MVATPKRTKATTAPASKSASRKGKVAWRKNIDLTEVESNLEAARAAERGGDGLYSMDTAGDEEVGRKTKRPLKSLEILQNKSATPPVGHMAGRRNVLSAATDEDAVARLRRAGVPAKSVRDQLRRAAGKVVTDRMGGIRAADQGTFQDYTGVSGVADRDLWDDEPPAPPKPTNYEPEWVEDPRDEKPKLPRSLATSEDALKPTLGKAPKSRAAHEQVAMARKVAAVPLPHPGMSYNPEAETHEELLNRAYQVELAQAKDEEEQARLRQWWNNMTAAEKDEILAKNGESDTVYHGMNIDVPQEDSDSEDEEDDGEPMDEEVALLREQQRQKAIKGKRKTKAQRHRHARAQEQLRLAAVRKAHNKHLADAPHKLREVPNIDATAQARLYAAQKRRQAKLELLRRSGLQGQKIAGQRLSATLGQGHDSVQLPEHLSENLRAMKTEGNLFRDRFRSMQTRALAEPKRETAARLDKKAKDSRKNSWKAVERFAFKNFQ